MIAGNIVFSALALLTFAVGMTNQFSYLSLLFLAVVWLRVIVLGNRAVIAISLTVTVLFFCRISVLSRKDSVLEAGDEVTVVVEVKETSLLVDGDKLVFEGMLREREGREKIRVTYYIQNQQEKEALRNGTLRKVLVKGTVELPASAANFNQFNYAAYLKNQQIDHLIAASEVMLVKEGRFNPFRLYGLDSFRQSILRYIDTTMSKQSAVYTKALVFADKRSFPEDVTESFKELGILHLLSISGLHVVFLIAMIKTLFIRLRISKETTASFLLLFLPAYGIAAGLGVSVLRAAGQNWIKLMSDKMTLTFTALDSWSLIFIVTLLIQPYSFLSIGFQLSYLISFLIIMVSHLPVYTALPRLLKAIFMNALLFLCAIPILSYHFYEFSWGVLIMNSLFIPFVSTVLLPLLVFNLAVSFFSPMTIVYTQTEALADKLITVMESVVNIVSANISFTFISGRLSLLAMVLIVFLLAGMLLMIETGKRKRLLTGPLAGILLCVLSVRYSPFGQVIMIDVNQGDAILIKEPWGKGNYLIDTGGQIVFPVEEWRQRTKRFSVGRNIVVPVLKSEGIHNLDSIIITHADIDHYGALLDIISEIKTEQILSSKTTFLDPNFQTLFPSIRKYGTIIKEVVEGTSKGMPENTFAVLSDKRSSRTSKNNSSLVLLSLIGNKTWLFTGDLEAEGEKELMIKYPNLAVDVLKVGHHGSETSTHEKFLKQMKPETAWISCGENNRYGHPHDSVLSALDESKTKIFRTDTDGAVKYTYSNQLLMEIVARHLFSFEHKGKQRGE